MIVRATTTDGGRIAFWSRDMACVQDIPEHDLTAGITMPHYINVCFKADAGMPYSAALDYSDELYERLVGELEGQG